MTSLLIMSCLKGRGNIKGINSAILYIKEVLLLKILVGVEVKEISRISDHVILQFTIVKEVMHSHVP